jgi:hypothetical protein
MAVDVDAWLNQFSPLEDVQLERGTAFCQLLAFLRQTSGDTIRLETVLQKEHDRLVVLTIPTGRPQRPIVPLEHEERVGILFRDDDSMPLVFMLRPDFPDTYHQQWVPEGCPRSICIDDRPWEEARLSWTPAELLFRISNWFQRAATGELHDARQPVDPQFLTSGFAFLIERAHLENPDADLIAIHEDAIGDTLRIEPLSAEAFERQNIQPICIFGYSVPPQEMQRLEHAPDTLASLATLLSGLGIDLLADLKGRFRDWLLKDAREANWRMHGRIGVVVEMPIVAPNNDPQQGSDFRAFVTTHIAGQIAVMLGIAVEDTDGAAGDTVRFRLALSATAADEDALGNTSILLAEIHVEFDRMLAARLSGQAEPDLRQVVLIGAGALGSGLAECLAREGRWRWTVIDHDRLLPHNLARHTASSSAIRKHKAEIVADRLRMILPADFAGTSTITKPITSKTTSEVEIISAFDGADLVIDATASVAAQRLISDQPCGARRFSVFFNADGRACVLLAEDSHRAITLRALEAQYLRAVCEVPDLHNHLQRQDAIVAYTGACRAITNEMPQSRVSILNGILASALASHSSKPEAAIMVWSLDSNSFEVSCHEVQVRQTDQYVVGEWRIVIDEKLTSDLRELRAQQLPQETGGVLYGLVDVPNKSIHLLMASRAPTDSEGSVSGFVRGSNGVAEEIAAIQKRTLGHVRYVGEWHSHPPRASTNPSPTDINQLDWLAQLMQLDSLPALMVIAGDQDIRVILAGTEAMLSKGNQSNGGRDG